MATCKSMQLGLVLEWLSCQFATTSLKTPMKRSLLIAGWKWKVLIQNMQMLNFVAGEFVSFQLLFFARF